MEENPEVRDSYYVLNCLPAHSLGVNDKRCYYLFRNQYLLPVDRQLQFDTAR
jgi:hypothetical protein